MTVGITPPVMPPVTTPPAQVTTPVTTEATPQVTPPVQQPVQQPTVQQPVQQPVLATPPEAAPVTGSEFKADTGNPVLDVAVNTFAKMTGATAADIEKAVASALKYNDPNLVDESFLKERFKGNAEQALQLAKAYVQQVNTQQAAQRQVAQQAVISVAGSEEAWTKAVDTFNAIADPETKGVIKTLLEAGHYKYGATQLMQYLQSSGRVPASSGQLLQGNASQGTLQGLSKDAFSTALQALKKEANGRSLESGIFGEKYNQLIQQRAIGRAAGI